MRRILIIGNSGSGKTWLSKKLSEELDTKAIHFDDHFWEPGGFNVKRDKETVHQEIESLSQNEQWIMEGVFGELAEIVTSRATLLIFLDKEWSECEEALLSREKDIDNNFLTWASEYYTRQSKAALSDHNRIFNDFVKAKISLKSRGETDSFLQKIFPTVAPLTTIDDDISFQQVNPSKAVEFLNLCLGIKETGMDYCPEIVTLVNDLDDSLYNLNDYLGKFEETKAPDYFIFYQGKIAGIIGFAPWDAGQKWAEIGYWVAPMFQRKGIARRSIQYILQNARKDFEIEEIRFLIEPENEASSKLALSLNPDKESEVIENGQKYLNYAILL